LKENRPPPVRLSKKSLFILEKLKAVNGRAVKAKAIEAALSDSYPLFSKLYNEGVK
jgi:hypothetical protein